MTSAKRIAFRIERTIPAPASEVFDAWMDPRVSGNPWNAAERFIVDAKVDGLFYWTLRGTSHYGRFIEFERPRRMQHTWVSPNTLGEESIVTVTFTSRDDQTVMALVHSNLPDHELARGHESGWSYFLGTFREQFGDGSRKEYRWEEAHPPTKEP
jgi:uncharacterized protein YndB with AHSA1/START domain